MYVRVHAYMCVCMCIVEILCLSAPRVMIIRLPLDNRGINVNCVTKGSSLSSTFHDFKRRSKQCMYIECSNSM